LTVLHSDKILELQKLTFGDHAMSIVVLLKPRVLWNAVICSNKKINFLTLRHV